MERSFRKLDRVTRVLMLGGAIALGATAHAQQVTVTVTPSDYYVEQVVVVYGAAGDTTFDPQDGDRIYTTLDATTPSGGGIYPLVDVAGILTRGAKVAAFSNPSGIAFTADGDLWVTNDFTPRLDVVRAPRNGAPYTIEQIISNYQTSADDDPIALEVAPAGFDGANVNPGDLVIADRGADDNPFNDFYVYTPNTTPANPAAYDVFLSDTFNLGAYNDNDMNDFGFSMSGTTLFAGFKLGKVVQLDFNGNVIGEVPVSGVTFTSIDAVAVNPIDGRIWVADDVLDEVWSVHPATGVAQLELKFAKMGATTPNIVNFHDPSMRFSADGQTLLITDEASPGYLWVLHRRGGVNNPPVALIETIPTNGVITLVGGVGELTLDGSGSTDGDGGAQGLTYSWTQLRGPAAAMDTPTAAVTDVTIPSGGDYVFALMVNDGQASDNVAVAQVWVYAPGASVIQEADTFACAKVYPYTGIPGDVAYDPTDGYTAYIADDNTPGTTGGIYRLGATTNGFEKTELLLALDGPSGIAFTPNGDLWYVRDGSAGSGAHLGVIRTPRNGAPYVSTNGITQFLTTADDDPFAVILVPPGFDGTNVDPGDLLIFDRGADSNTPNAIFVYKPSAPTGNPGAYANFFMPPSSLTAYDNNDGNGIAFSPDGTKLYLAFNNLIVEVDSEGTILRELPVSGVSFNNIDAMSVNPNDGRIWVADDDLDELWSLDPVTAVGQLEMTFVLGGETRPDFNINFHDPSLNFSPDGARLILGDVATVRWLWVFKTVRDVLPDFNCDGDVDLMDYGVLAGCLVGGPGSPAAPACDLADLDGDNDVDLLDFSVLQKCFSGDGQPADPACDG